MIKADFHGYRLDEAIQCVHSLVGNVRKEFVTEECELITGHGIIRDKVLETLRGYGLYPSIKIGNSGVVKCLVE
jgi:hypothetical protein